MPESRSAACSRGASGVRCRPAHPCCPRSSRRWRRHAGGTRVQNMAVRDTSMRGNNTRRSSLQNMAVLDTSRRGNIESVYFLREVNKDNEYGYAPTQRSNQPTNPIIAAAASLRASPGAGLGLRIWFAHRTAESATRARRREVVAQERSRSRWFPTQQRQLRWFATQHADARLSKEFDQQVVPQKGMHITRPDPYSDT